MVIFNSSPKIQLRIIPRSYFFHLQNLTTNLINVMHFKSLEYSKRETSAKTNDEGHYLINGLNVSTVIRESECHH